ncbi:ABC transporter substrate-binding protein [Aggregicoccus sp. 17bor-14]|uniref:ABC transporter substrate-binding protein n=1 Tax=Myxococcaceae TaxID=31 RepID=UPI00129CE568|nr:MULTISPECIES: ABC transporter substrate-binding protein [Myxococcaceae]MBF5042959.1 ABC transporter substrate-binding protein [Simulacricoccus sp. 17bor-14]MRI88725.1 ABC transporter substrate-binding protein [Aggregicoccus sp. 17bor-14]
MKRVLLSITAALLFAVPASAQIKVGVYGPFTGGSAGMGVSMRNGATLAAEEINKSGGILGKQVVLVARDDEAKNERGGQIMQEFVDKEKVVAVLGPINTGVADSSTRYANEAKVPVIINASAGAKVNELFPQYPENYIFRIAANDLVQTEMVVKEAVDVRGHKKPAILADDTNYGQGGRAKLEAALQKRGVKPVYVGKFKIKDTDMTAQLQEAKAAGADALLVYGIGPELAAIANSLDRLGWKPDMIGGWTLSMQAFMKNAGKNGNGAVAPVTFIEGDLTNPKQQKFVEAYYKRFNEKPMSVAVAAAQGYDSLYLLKQAIEQAKSTDGDKIRLALEDLQKPFEGITATYTKPFNSKNHEAVTEKTVRMGVVKDGTVVPKSAAGAPKK